MTTSEIRVTCPRCGGLYARVCIDGNVTPKVRAEVRELVLAAHVSDYHPAVWSRWKATVERARRENAGAR